MADAITIKALQDASLDAKSLKEAVNGSETKQVTTRLGETYPSVKKAIKTLFENGGLPAAPFATKALMTASALVDGDYAQVTDDTANNGLYIKTAGAWVKSGYDPTAVSNSYTDNKVKSVTNNFKTKALMTASSLPNDSYAMVTEDTEANNGWYSKVSGAWVKSTYDPLAQSKGYTDLQLSKSVGTFDTLALLTASALIDNAYGTVVNDTEAKNGHYKKTAGVWVKTTYDPYNKAIKHTDKETAFSKDATANLLRGLQASDLSIINLDDENTRTLGTLKVQTEINTSTNRAIQVVSQVVTTLDNINKEAEFSNLYHKSRELVELGKLDGFDPKDSDVSAKPLLDNTYVFGEPRRLIRIDMTMPYIPASKDDGDIEGTVKVNVDGEILSSHAIFSVQGASSAAFRKKNLNVEFCTDDTYDTDVFLKIGDILPHAKWVYKANFIDHSQARNLTGYRLWKQMQDLRTGYPAKDIDNYYVGKTGAAAINTQASGHPDGATCVTYVNGQFYGLGTFLIGKRNENYNLDKANPNHIAFNFAPGDDQDITIRLLMNELEEGTFELRHPKNYTPLATQRFAEFAAVNDLPQAEFNVAVRNVLDTRNVVDFYLHNNMLGNWDAQINNTQCVTWDGVRWYFFPYDLDQVFVKGNMTGDVMKKTQNGFYWTKVYNTYETEIIARYAELRKTVFTLKNFDDLFKRITLGIPLEFYLAEQSKWGGELVSHTEYMEWVRGRLANLDTIFNYTEVN